MLKIMYSFEILPILFWTWLIGLTPRSTVSGQIHTGNWTWLSGDNYINQNGIYGTVEVADGKNRPGTREGHSMVMDPSGQWMFVFGGSGYAAMSSGKTGFTPHY